MKGRLLCVKVAIHTNTAAIKPLLEHSSDTSGIKVKNSATADRMKNSQMLQGLFARRARTLSLLQLQPQYVQSISKSRIDSSQPIAINVFLVFSSAIFSLNLGQDALFLHATSPGVSTGELKLSIEDHLNRFMRYFVGALISAEPS